MNRRMKFVCLRTLLALLLCLFMIAGVGGWFIFDTFAADLAAKITYKVSGDNLVLSANVTDRTVSDSALSYQWYVSKDGGKNYSLLMGQTGKDYSYPLKNMNDKVVFKCAINEKYVTANALICDGYRAFGHRGVDSEADMERDGFMSWYRHLYEHSLAYESGTWGTLFTQSYKPVNEAAAIAADLVFSCEYLSLRGFNPDGTSYSMTPGLVQNNPKQLIVDCYHFFLGRDPGTSEIDYWYDQVWKKAVSTSGYIGGDVVKGLCGIMTHTNHQGKMKEITAYSGMMDIINGIASSDACAAHFAQIYDYDASVGKFLYTDSDVTVRSRNKSIAPVATVPPSVYTFEITCVDMVKGTNTKLGTQTNKIKVVYGNSISGSKWGSNTGNGYYYKEYCYDSASIIDKVTKNDTVYRYFVPSGYELSFQLNGGKSSGTLPGKAERATWFTVGNPTRNGFAFQGWTITGMDGSSHRYGISTASYASTTAASLTGVYGTWFYNLRSGSGKVTFTANWKDTTPPALELSYKNADGTVYLPGTWTRQSVQVIATGTDEGSGIAGISWDGNPIEGDGNGKAPHTLTSTKQLTETGLFSGTVLLLDKADSANTVQGSAWLANDRKNEVRSTYGEVKIDKMPPSAILHYDSKEITNESTLVYIIASDQHAGLDTYAYSYDGGKTWKKENYLSVTENGTGTALVRDAVGNQTKVEYEVTWIDKMGPPIVDNTPGKYKEEVQRENSKGTGNNGENDGENDGENGGGDKSEAGGNSSPFGIPRYKEELICDSPSSGPGGSHGDGGSGGGNGGDNSSGGNEQGAFTGGLGTYTYTREYDWVNHSVPLSFSSKDPEPSGGLDFICIYRSNSEFAARKLLACSESDSTNAAEITYEVTEEGISHYIVESKDKAGNCVQIFVTVKIDFLAPGLTFTEEEIKACITAVEAPADGVSACSGLKEIFYAVTNTATGESVKGSKAFPASPLQLQGEVELSKIGGEIGETPGIQEMPGTDIDGEAESFVILYDAVDYAGNSVLNQRNRTEKSLDLRVWSKFYQTHSGPGPEENTYILLQENGTDKGYFRSGEDIFLEISTGGFIDMVVTVFPNSYTDESGTRHLDVSWTNHQELLQVVTAENGEQRVIPVLENQPPVFSTYTYPAASDGRKTQLYELILPENAKDGSGYAIVVTAKRASAFGGDPEQISKTFIFDIHGNVSDDLKTVLTRPGN